MKRREEATSVAADARDRRRSKRKREEKGNAMDVKKLIAGALAATALTVGGGAAIAAQ